MGDARPSIDSPFDTFGVAATITPVGGSATAATIVWLTPATQGFPAGGEFTRKEIVRTAAVRRSDVATLPKGSAIVAPEIEGGTRLGWRVDEFEHGDPEHQRVVVIRDASLDP
jgi:hypothetical protein